MTRGRWRQFADDLPGEVDRFYFVQARERERITAVQDLADVYAALGVLTQAAALAEIERLKVKRPFVEWAET